MQKKKGGWGLGLRPSHTSCRSSQFGPCPGAYERVYETINISRRASRTPSEGANLGSGNDSVRNGPWSSRFLRNDHAGRFAFHVETRTQRLAQQRATDTLSSLAR